MVEQLIIGIGVGVAAFASGYIIGVAAGEYRSNKRNAFRINSLRDQVDSLRAVLRKEK